MAYKQKIVSIQQGNIVEVTKTQRLPVKNKIRNNRQNVTTLVQSELNNKNAINNLRLLLLENFTAEDLYCTLTYKNEPTPAEAKKELANFRQRLQRFYKKLDAEVKYISITECLTKKQRIHHHIIIHVDNIRIKLSDIKSLWLNGWVKARVFGGTIEDCQRLANYLVKKKRNAFFTQPHIYIKRWNSSKNLQKPQQITAIIHHKTWRNEPKIKKGYYLDKDSLINGYYIFEEGYYEYEYQFYRIIRLQQKEQPIKT